MIQVNEKEYEIQKYQGEHQNEYLISEMKDGKVEGRCELFENGILRLSWMIKDGQRIGRISEYEKGKALFKEEWESALGEGDSRKIENSKEGLKLVIRDRDNNTMIYQGEFDEELNRHGKGLEYDDNGELKYEGYWKRDELVRIAKEFKEDEMIEYEDCDNADVLNRIPLYVGGYNIVNGEFKRNGIGYLVDNKTGTAIRESKWFNGEEVNGIDLFDGWYVNGIKESIRCVLNNKHPEEIVDITTKKVVLEIHKSIELKTVDIHVTDLVIGSNCCNDIRSLSFNECKYLESIEIGDESFSSVDTFLIDGLKHLNSIRIGANSFTRKKGWYGNKSGRSFHILNCDELESITLGHHSFSDYGGEFELMNLPKLYSINIGDTFRESYNFYYCSFVIESIADIIIVK